MRFPVYLALAFYALPALAHPSPDVPVRARFADAGEAVIQVEVDPRCFEEDSLHAPYLTRRELDELSPAQRRQLEERAAAFIAATIRFFFEPTAMTLEFHYTFTTHGGKPLGRDPDTPVMVKVNAPLRYPTTSSMAGIESTASKGAEHDRRGDERRVGVVALGDHRVDDGAGHTVGD